jgi:hypothetical protein
MPNSIKMAKTFSKGVMGRQDSQENLVLTEALALKRIRPTSHRRHDCQKVENLPRNPFTRQERDV